MLFFKGARHREQFLQTVYPKLSFVFNMAYRLSGNRYDAEDLTQETFSIAFQKLHQLKDEGKCKSWLLAILRNLYLNGCEKKRPDLLEAAEDEDYFSMIEGLATGDNPEEFLIEKAGTQEVQKIVGALPEKYMTPLVLFYTEEWSYREISEGLDLPIGTVMSRIGRGREMVKKEILEGRKRQGVTKVIDFARNSRKGRGEP